jgi:signal transduction histidine kinase
MQRPLEKHGPGAGEPGIDAIDVTAALHLRPAREADYRAENEAFGRLADTLARQPERMAQMLADTALQLTSADSAGVSLEEEVAGRRHFRWIATAGGLEKYLNTTMPRDASPCGAVLDRNQPILMADPARCYDRLLELDRPVHEVLLVPFYEGSSPVGTVWVVSDSEAKRFDPEDFRLLTGLTRFAAAAVQTVGLVSRLRVVNATNERELLASRREFRMLAQWFEQAPGFVALTRGPTHVFEMVNRAFAVLTGREDLVGRPVFEALPELRDQGFEPLLDRVYRTGRPYVGREMKLGLGPRQDAPPLEKFVDFIYQPVLAADGTVEGIFVQGHDCTERRLALERLTEVDQRKDDFLATLSHELRSPLGVLSSAVHLLKRQVRNGAAPPSNVVEIMERQTAQLAALVDDMTDMASIRSGKVELRIESLVMQDVVTRALEHCAAQLEARQHRLVLSVPEEPVGLQGDGVRLTQVLTNLLNNAAKYTNAGGTIGVAVVPADDAVEVRVTDTGIGMSAHQLPRVFDMFMQAAPAERTLYGGLGIGLSLVRRFVELHGGSVTARSDGPGRGSEFVVRLPRRRAAPAPA